MNVWSGLPASAWSWVDDARRRERKRVALRYPVAGVVVPARGPKRDYLKPPSWRLPVSSRRRGDG
jgi:hypothetical protein